MTGCDWPAIRRSCLRLPTLIVRKTGWIAWRKDGNILERRARQLKAPFPSSFALHLSRDRYVRSLAVPSPSTRFGNLDPAINDGKRVCWLSRRSLPECRRRRPRALNWENGPIWSWRYIIGQLNGSQKSQSRAMIFHRSHVWYQSMGGTPSHFPSRIANLSYWWS